MAAWIRSVEEALQVVHHHDTHLQEVARTFFGGANQPEVSMDSDSTYSISSRSTSVVTPSIDPTVATTATYNTLSSAASSTSGPYYLHYDGDDASFSTTDTADSSNSLVITLSDDQSVDRLSVADQPQDFGGSVCSFSTSDTSSNDWDVH
jgi:hypothetical protein